MSLAEPTESIAHPSLLRRLDYVPAWLAIALGIGAGALLGIGLAMSSPIVAWLGFVVLLGCAVALAFSGEPTPSTLEVELVKIPARVSGG